MGTKISIAALIGNGLSIAYNDNLVISKITERIIQRLDAAGDEHTQQAQLMRLVAERAGRSSAAADFEELVSPFDEMRDTLPIISRMADLAGASGLVIERALLDSAEFADQVYRHGVSHILDVIANDSYAHDEDMAPIRHLLDQIVIATNGGEVAFGNLNYDALLMAGCCSRQGPERFCDLTDGRYNKVEKLITPDAFAYGRPLRTMGNLPLNREIALVHLHGSLAWLREPGTGRVYRFDMADLRDADYWTAWREGRTNWAPVVVLTNQTGKSKLIKQPPFDLAYDVFKQRLLTADKWLIAGTSLRDVAVNQMLREAWQGRSSTPQVLVITKGENPTDREILNAIGYDPIWADDPDPSKWLEIARDGIFESVNSWEWFIWTIQSPLPKMAAA